VDRYADCEVDKYADCMEAIQMHIKAINDVLDRTPPMFMIRDVEFVALQLRKILELIVFANLSAHIEQYQAIRSSYANDWNINRIRKHIKTINPDYYPKAIRPPSGCKNDIGVLKISIESLSEGFLTESEYASEYQHLSTLIHAQNPFNTTAIQVVDELNRLDNIRKKIITLLNYHQVRLSNGDVIHCEMSLALGKKSNLKIVKLKLV